MKKVLFVCMGNICRSPTAHAVMQHKVVQRSLSKIISVDSAGTHAYHVGEKSDSRARALTQGRGIDMEYVRARKISINDYDEFDYILAMDNDNLELINYYSPQGHGSDARLFLSFANLTGEITETEVPDPYYGGAEGFEHVFDLVDRGCNALIEHLLNA